MSRVEGRVVVIGGGTSASGWAVARALLNGGATVVSVGSDAARLAALTSGVPGVIGELCDLTDEAAVVALAERIRERFESVDGLIHLVGGWRGGGGLAGQTDEDYRALEVGLTALRHTSRAFWGELIESEAGRFAMVSATAVANPTPGGANYTAVKAASESWTRSLASGFAAAGDRGAAVIYRVRSLAGLEEQLAASVVTLWSRDAPTLNAEVIPLALP